MKVSVLGCPIDTTSYSQVANQVVDWSSEGQNRRIYIANVHMLMEAYDSPIFHQMVNSADLVTPDGMPLVWIMRAKGIQNQERVYGPVLMLHILELAAQNNVPVGFYGGSPKVLDELIKQMQARYEKLNISFFFSPPYRELTLQEDNEIVHKINQSGTQILFIGLGCPKQEIWMADHSDSVKAVLIGVGAAFDFNAGVKPQAPIWMQRMGLEWLFRLFSEPRRLWVRYLYHNPRFIFLAIADLLGFVH